MKGVSQNTATELVNQFITAPTNIAILNYNTYNALYILIYGDSYNGNAIYVPKGMLFGLEIPFSFYSSHNSPVPIDTGYSMRANGRYASGVLYVSYVYVYSWTGIYVNIYGLK